MRTEQEIIDQTNALAREFYAIMGFHVREGYRFDQAMRGRARDMWQMACLAQDRLTDTDVDNALAEVSVAEEPA